MKMEKEISVFGCGWLGEPLAHSLVKKGYTVKGSTTSQNKISILKSKGITPFLLTLENIDATILPFLNTEILVVNIPSKNIEGFKTLISFIEQSAIKKVVFISSTSVYGTSNDIVSENSPVKNCALIAIENLFRLNTHFKTTVVRFAGLLGYNRKPGNFFKNGRSIPNPKGVVNMIHQDDCISIIEEIIAQHCWGEIFNACADTHPNRRDFYTKSFADIGLGIPVFNEEDALQLKIISNQKVKAVLDFEFKYPDLLNLPA